ncbi:hypothetical protein [Pseudonocardia alni]|nr:hypothetical protein [Pseudonocardia alni]
MSTVLVPGTVVAGRYTVGERLGRPRSPRSCTTAGSSPSSTSWNSTAARC